MITITRPLYTKVLVIAMILAITLCGPLVTTSCSSDKEDTEIPPALKQAPAQKQMVSMLQNLGLIATTSTTRASSAVLKGDLKELSFHDVYDALNVNIIINEDESTSSQMVFYGTKKSTVDDSVDKFRYKVTSSGNVLTFKEELKSGDSYVANKTYEYAANSDGSVVKKQVMPDGSKIEHGTYSSNDYNSLKFTTTSGQVRKVDNVFVGLK